MTFPLWRYGAYAFALTATLAMAAANAAWAVALDEGVYRVVMIALSVAADVGAICALMAIFHYQAEGDAVSVISAVAIWACCGYAEVRGAETWLKANSHILSAPAARASEAQKAAKTELESEAGNLSDIRRQLAGERREVKLDTLRQREREALARIERLRPQTFTTGIEPARSQYVGNELGLSFALWLLSQLAWRVAVGKPRVTASQQPTNHWSPNQPLVAQPLTLRPTNQPLVAQPASTSQPTTGQPVNQPASTSQPTSVNQSTNHWSPNQHPLKTVGKPASTSVNQRQPTNQPVVAQPASTTGRPTSVNQSTSGRSVGPTEFQATVRDLVRAGLSEREIVDKTGRTRHQVREAKAALKTRSATLGDNGDAQRGDVTDVTYN